MPYYPPFIKDSTSLVTGLRGSSPAWYCAQAAADSPVCCILPDEQMIAGFEQDISFFTDLPVIAYPGYEIPAYTPLSPDQRTTAARLSALYQMMESRKSFILAVSIEAFLRRVMPRHLLQQHAELLMEGEDFDHQKLRASLVTMGYEQTSLVKDFGDFSIRGGVVDIYPPPFLLPDGQLHDSPIRLDFFGDTIESIRPFNPLSQRSTGHIEEAVVLPVSDILLGGDDPAPLDQALRIFRQQGEACGWSSDKTHEIIECLKSGRRFAGIEFFLPLFSGSQEQKSATVLDYLPKDTRLIFVDPQAISQQAQIVCERIEANFSTARQQKTPALPPGELFISIDHLADATGKFKNSAFTDFVAEESSALNFPSTNHQLLKQEISLQRKKHGLLTPLAEQIIAWLEDGDTVIIGCRSEHRQKTLAELLQRFPFTCLPLTGPLNLDKLPQAGTTTALYLCDRPLSSGFSMAEKQLHLISESELFGDMRLGGKKQRKQKETEPINFTQLQDGDIVVHRDHGLGKYRGLVTMQLQGVINDFMLLEYRDQDKLYLPVDRLNLVSRYEGLSDKEPKIDKLGSQSWKTTKQKISDEVWKVAEELLAIYAQRELRTGRAFSPAGELYRELEESFAFDETPGQYRAITDTIDDLTSDRPMDRLICGDVGYGKTEVAIRAAFKVVDDGFQAAVLVPTTVLAEQHAKTFRERFKDFPVRIECINRFRTQKQQKEIVADCKNGSIDIIIGTHRLLSKDIVFAKLGLLIVDEEHRFGVAHKEKIKRIKAEVDILTLTATPIPRTLQLSLLGIRDLSVISTPPQHRRPIKTFVARYDDLVIKEAVSRELVRGGQVFLVHNRVKSIHRMAANLQKLVPQARVAVAHGQMAGKELEEIMVAFVKQEIDVLVSTTIIESGLDIPTANTIIINRADRLGLAEIYQLRGRVGRSSTQSFAYMLVPSLDHLSKESRERLRALMEYNELGGGFKLAMSDLQIRGGGNLLGVSQSGHIAAIGYDLYLELLQKTVADLKAKDQEGHSGAFRDDLDPEINLQISAYLPESFIADISQRYILYRRIAASSREDNAFLEDLKDELVDRYGPLPDEVINLFRIVAIKKALIPLRVNKLERGPQNLVLSFMTDTPVKTELLLNYLQKTDNNSRITPDGRLIIDASTDSDESLYEAVNTTLLTLNRLTHEPATK